MLVGTAVKIVSAYILIGNKEINIYGAPISTLLSVIAIASVNIYFILKNSCKMSSVYELFVKPFIASLISIIAGVGLNFALERVLSGKIAIIVVILFVAVLYLLLVLKLKAITDTEIEMLSKGEKINKILKKIHLL